MDGALLYTLSTLLIENWIDRPPPLSNLLIWCHCMEEFWCSWLQQLATAYTILVSPFNFATHRCTFWLVLFSCCVPGGDGQTWFAIWLPIYHRVLATAICWQAVQVGQHQIHHSSNKCGGLNAVVLFFIICYCNTVLLHAPYSAYQSFYNSTINRSLLGHEEMFRWALLMSLWEQHAATLVVLAATLL